MIGVQDFPDPGDPFEQPDGGPRNDALVHPVYFPFAHGPDGCKSGNGTDLVDGCLVHVPGLRQVDVDFLPPGNDPLHAEIGDVGPPRRARVMGDVDPARAIKREKRHGAGRKGFEAPMDRLEIDGFSLRDCTGNGFGFGYARLKALHHRFGRRLPPGKPSQDAPVGFHLVDIPRLEGNNLYPEPPKLLHEPGIPVVQHGPDNDQVRGCRQKPLRAVPGGKGFFLFRPSADVSVHGRIDPAHAHDLIRRTQCIEVFRMGRIERNDAGKRLAHPDFPAGAVPDRIFPDQGHAAGTARPGETGFRGTGDKSCDPEQQADPEQPVSRYK